jgi:hemerythrin
MEAHLTLLTWNHTCTIGVRAMDDQHGILMDTMNEIRLASIRGAGREQIHLLMNQLIEFTEMHFASEEQLMEQNGFPSLAEHRAGHQRLLAHLHESAHWVQHGETVPMRTLLGFLRDAFFEHMEGLDQQFGPWLNERGIS